MSLPLPSPIVRQYGLVELLLSDLYPPGDVVAVDARLRLRVVDEVEGADGVVVLGFSPREGFRYPACHCVLFTHYYHNPYGDSVDRFTTHYKLSGKHGPSEVIRRRTEYAFCTDLASRSLVASLTYNPTIRYLDA